VVLSDEVLVGEDEGVAVHGADGELLIDPGQLVDDVVVGAPAAVGTGELVEQDEPDVAVVERVAQAGEARAVGAREPGRSEDPVSQPLRLWVEAHELLRGEPAPLVVAAEREEADPRVVERLGRGSADRHVAPRAIAVQRVVLDVDEVADLDHELDPVPDELGVEEVHDPHCHGPRVLTVQVLLPLRVGHHAEFPRRGCALGGAGRRAEPPRRSSDERASEPQSTPLHEVSAIHA
jgi:hypothetical protein